MVNYYNCLIIIAILTYSITCGYMCNQLAISKGYTGYFATGFIFGFIGLIYVSGLPNANQMKIAEQQALLYAMAMRMSNDELRAAINGRFSQETVTKLFGGKFALDSCNEQESILHESPIASNLYYSVHEKPSDPAMAYSKYEGGWMCTSCWSDNRSDRYICFRCGKDKPT